MLGYLERGQSYVFAGAFYLFSLLRLGHGDVFSAVDYCPGAQQTGHPGDFPAESVPGMERDWLGRRTDLGGEARCAGGGEVTSGL